MDEVRIVKSRTQWPMIIALIVLALVIGFVLYAWIGPAQVRQVGWVTAGSDARLAYAGSSLARFG